MDPDVVADPDDISYLREEIDQYTDDIVHVPHKLWPASTGRDEWVWSYGRHDGTMPVMSQQHHHDPGWCAIGLTYTPARLLDIVAADMPFWEFGQIDMTLAATARQHDIPIRVCDGVQVKHVHFTPGPDYLAWTRTPS